MIQIISRFKKILIIFVISLLLSGLYFYHARGSSSKNIVFCAVGDIMLDRNVELVINQQGDNFKFPFLRIAEYLKKADILFGNLESVLSNEKGEKAKKADVYVYFEADPKAIEGLIYAGFDIVSVAIITPLIMGGRFLRIAWKD